MRALHAVLLSAVVMSAIVPVGIAAPRVTSNEASLERIGVWQAPTNVTDFDDASDVRTAITDGTLTRATSVTHDDTLVMGIQMRGFTDIVSAANGSNVTEQFQSAMSTHGDLLVEQTNPPPSRQAMQVHVLNWTGVTVLPDDANDTYYVVVDLDEARITRGEDGDRESLDHGPYEFIVRAELAADSPLTEDRQYAVAPVDSRKASLETAPDGKVHVEAGSNLTVSGTTNVGTSWPVTVVLSGDDNADTSANESFQVTREATVQPSEERNRHYRRTFDTAFDRETVPITAENVTVNVRFAGRSLLDEPVPVALADPRASVTVDGIYEDGNITALSVNASLSVGGFLVLHEESADGTVVGHTKYLGSGEHAVSVYSSEPIDADEVVVVAHRDSNHNEWFDGPNRDRAYAEKDPDEAITFGQTRSSMPTETTTASTPTDATITSSADDTSSRGATPGFGVTATTFAVLIALGVLGRR
ncbi:DUF7282 domain-containing protein [Halorussus salinisoli]|uniref:DUF7282 domain-containing protein n=1 Tax=Halorussus salinisoli TaxID=2558242 RepID=UPI0010C20121|nr:hypothetical protein [Halorussus salinisoli]